jgi:hypothetical protein
VPVEGRGDAELMAAHGLVVAVVLGDEVIAAAREMGGAGAGEVVWIGPLAGHSKLICWVCAIAGMATVAAGQRWRKPKFIANWSRAGWMSVEPNLTLCPDGRLCPQ